MSLCESAANCVGTSEYQWVPVGSQWYQWVPVGTNAVGTSEYQEYREDQDQISSGTYISDVVFGTLVPGILVPTGTHWYLIVPDCT